MYLTEQEFRSKLAQVLLEAKETIQNRPWWKESFSINVDAESIYLTNPKWNVNKSGRSVEIGIYDLDIENNLSCIRETNTGIWVQEAIGKRMTREILAQKCKLDISKSVKRPIGADQKYRDQWILFETFADKEEIIKAYKDLAKLIEMIVSKFDSYAVYIAKLNKAFAVK
jgi:hypothetical protein